MRSTKIVHMVSCHAEGEVGNVIVGGVVPPPGDSIWDQSRWIDNDGTLRKFVLNEPRGGVFKHVAIRLPLIRENSIDHPVALDALREWRFFTLRGKCKSGIVSLPIP